MPKAPRLTGKQLARILVRHGFELRRVRGSHHRLRHQDGRVTTIPVHAGETIGPGLLRQILRDTRLTMDDLKT
ncbi:MAG TPA: type II toxin-antitoxin system HicA family toxin [Chthoniobacterales bacterium]|nr:type II toxin-antitoxin system HicA family toxin [Chthoniobacterales bacterium]